MLSILLQVYKIKVIDVALKTNLVFNNLESL